MLSIAPRTRLLLTASAGGAVALALVPAGAATAAPQPVRVPLRQSPPITAAGFTTHDACPRTPAGRDYWHFAVPAKPSKNTFLSLTVRFQPGGTRTFEINGLREVRLASASGATLLDASALVSKKARWFSLVGTCPARVGQAGRTPASTPTPAGKNVAAGPDRYAYQPYDVPEMVGVPTEPESGTRRAGGAGGARSDPPAAPPGAGAGTGPGAAPNDAPDAGPGGTGGTGEAASQPGSRPGPASEAPGRLPSTSALLVTGVALLLALGVIAHQILTAASRPLAGGASGPPRFRQLAQRLFRRTRN